MHARCRYPHDNGCAIVGGDFYRPSGPRPANTSLPPPGAYLFMDFCAGWVQYLPFPAGPDGDPGPPVTLVSQLTASILGLRVDQTDGKVCGVWCTWCV
jgi:hypothetical protein